MVLLLGRLSLWRLVGTNWMFDRRHRKTEVTNRGFNGTGRGKNSQLYLFSSPGYNIQSRVFVVLCLSGKNVFNASLKKMSKVTVPSLIVSLGLKGWCAWFEEAKLKISSFCAWSLVAFWLFFFFFFISRGASQCGKSRGKAQITKKTNKKQNHQFVKLSHN